LALEIRLGNTVTAEAQTGARSHNRNHDNTFPSQAFHRTLCGRAQEITMGAQLEQGKLNLFLSDDSRTMQEFTLKQKINIALQAYRQTHEQAK
jgi:hypothetical protein